MLKIANIGSFSLFSTKVSWENVVGDVIRCLESKFDKKIPMGSVPNCRKEKKLSIPII